MKIVVRGLVALALSIVGNTTHGVTFTAVGLGNAINRIPGISSILAISDLKQIIPLSNTANGPLRPCQMAIRYKRFNGKAVQSSISKQENKSGEVGREGPRAW